MNDYLDRNSQPSYTESQMISADDGAGDHNYQGKTLLFEYPFYLFNSKFIPLTMLLPIHHHEHQYSWFFFNYNYASFMTIEVY